MNSNGDVLSWKVTKSLSFDSVKDMLESLQQRLLNQGKQVQEFIIDNCCSWRKKLQSIFGPQMRVLLDLFHAVQRISTSMSKRHPFHKNCLQDLSLVFRDPNDQGQVRALETPAPTILLDNLGKFINKWTGVDYEGQKVLTPKVMQQLTAIQKHVERGCLSHIQVGRGTNRNERLHRQLNSVLKSNRYGPEMANALITVTFFKHNEHLLAKAENRPPNPVSAYGLHSSQTQGENECFGLVTTSTTDTSLPQASSCTLKDVSYSQDSGVRYA